MKNEIREIVQMCCSETLTETFFRKLSWVVTYLLVKLVFHKLTQESFSQVRLLERIILYLPDLFDHMRLTILGAVLQINIFRFLKNALPQQLSPLLLKWRNLNLDLRIQEYPKPSLLRNIWHGLFRHRHVIASIFFDAFEPSRARLAVIVHHKLLRVLVVWLLSLRALALRGDLGGGVGVTLLVEIVCDFKQARRGPFLNKRLCLVDSLVEITGVSRLDNALLCTCQFDILDLNERLVYFLIKHFF